MQINKPNSDQTVPKGLDIYDSFITSVDSHSYWELISKKIKNMLINRTKAEIKYITRCNLEMFIITNICARVFEYEVLVFEYEVHL